MASHRNDRQPQKQDSSRESRKPAQSEPAPDPEAGFDREVGDLDDPDAEDGGALPGRVGGGLAGG